MKPRLLPTCGVCWTWWGARPDSPSPNGPRPPRTLSPRRVGPDPTTRAPAHLHLPMGETSVRHRRNQNRPFRRSRRASGWSPFIRRRSSPTSTSSSLSLTSPHPFSVSARLSLSREFIFFSALFGSSENALKYSPLLFTFYSVDVRRCDVEDAHERRDVDYFQIQVPL